MSLPLSLPLSLNPSHLVNTSTVWRSFSFSHKLIIDSFFAGPHAAPESQRLHGASTGFRHLHGHGRGRRRLRYAALSAALYQLLVPESSRATQRPACRPVRPAGCHVAATTAAATASWPWSRPPCGHAACQFDTGRSLLGSRRSAALWSQPGLGGLIQHAFDQLQSRGGWRCCCRCSRRGRCQQQLQNGTRDDVLCGKRSGTRRLNMNYDFTQRVLTDLLFQNTSSDVNHTDGLINSFFNDEDLHLMDMTESK